MSWYQKSITILDTGNRLFFFKCNDSFSVSSGVAKGLLTIISLLVQGTDLEQEKLGQSKGSEER